MTLEFTKVFVRCLFPDKHLLRSLHLVGYLLFYRLQMHVFRSLFRSVIDSLDFISALLIVRQQL